MKVVSICLTDLPKDKITVSEKNDKKYISLVVDDKKETDKFGNNVTVYVNQSKEEREAKTDRTYVGQGKTFDFTPKQQAPLKYNTPNDDDLPF